MNLALRPVFNEVFVTDRRKFSHHDRQAGGNERQPYPTLKRGNHQTGIETGYHESCDDGPPEWQIDTEDTDRDCRKRLECYRRAQMGATNKAVAQDSIQDGRMNLNTRHFACVSIGCQKYIMQTFGCSSNEHDLVTE